MASQEQNVAPWTASQISSRMILKQIEMRRNAKRAQLAKKPANGVFTSSVSSALPFSSPLPLSSQPMSSPRSTLQATVNREKRRKNTSGPRTKRRKIENAEVERLFTGEKQVDEIELFEAAEEVNQQELETESEKEIEKEEKEKEEEIEIGEQIEEIVEEEIEPAEKNNSVRSKKRKNDESYCVYLLQSMANKNRTYCGITNRRDRRIRQHNGEIKRGARQTRSGRPWIMYAVVEGFATKVEALQFEWSCHHPRARRLRAPHYGRDGRINCVMQLFASDAWCRKPLKLYVCRTAGKCIATASSLNEFLSSDNSLAGEIMPMLISE